MLDQLADQLNAQLPTRTSAGFVAQLEASRIGPGAVPHEARAGANETWGKTREARGKASGARGNAFGAQGKAFGARGNTNRLLGGWPHNSYATALARFASDGAPGAWSESRNALLRARNNMDRARFTLVRARDVLTRARNALVEARFAVIEARFVAYETWLGMGAAG